MNARLFPRVWRRSVLFLLAIATSLAAAQTQDRKPKPAAADFNMAAYLKQLSAKGKERGYKEYVYKQTPQGELRIYFAMPKDWSPNDCRPAVVFFYGGGWGSGNVFSYDEQSEYFAMCGVVAGMADYRVRTRHGVTPDKCVEDARSLVRWLRANCRKLGIDPNRVIAGGGSAGAHVAACTAIPNAPNSETDDLKVSCIPNGLMLCFPVASLVDDIRSSAFQQVLGEEMALKLSPARHVSKSWPPTILFFGNADRLLPGGIMLYNKARQAGVVSELYLADGQGHGFVNIAPWNYISSRYAADFFMRAGVLPKAALPDAPPGELKKYNGEPIEKVHVKTNENPTRQRLNHGGQREQSQPPASAEPGSGPQSPVAPEETAPQPTIDQLQQVLRRFPDADLNKDGKLTLQEAREFQRKVRTPAAAAASSGSTAAFAPAAATAGRSPVVAGKPVGVVIATARMSDVNNAIFGMMTVHYLEKWNTRDPEFAKLAKNMGVTHFQYPGGSLNYWWHYDPQGVGYCFKKEEYAQAASQRHADSMKVTENFLNKFIDLCKATGASAIVNANVWHGTLDELDGALSEIERNEVKVQSVILGVELQLGGGRIMTAEEYVTRARKYVAMLRAKHPGVKVYAWAAPVDRVKANQYSSQWNAAVSKIGDVDGMVQYQWCRNALHPGGTVDERFDYAMAELKAFMAGLEKENAALAQYSTHWVIDQWGMVDLGSPGGAKSAYGGTMLQFIHTCWYLLYVTDYNFHHPGFYQSLEYMKFGSSYNHDPLSLNDPRDPRSGYRINPAYDAFQLLSNIQGANYAPAIVARSPDVKAYYFEKDQQKYLFTINLEKSITAINAVTVNGAALTPVLKRAYWSDSLSAARGEIKSIDQGEAVLRPYSVSWFLLE